MPQIEKNRLNKSDTFPKLELQLVSGNSLNVPEETGENWTILLFYRGRW